MRCAICDVLLSLGRNSDICSVCAEIVKETVEGTFDVDTGQSDSDTALLRPEAGEGDEA